ncbi:MAG: amidohydrolase family protein [Trebonia sp.]
MSAIVLRNGRIGVDGPVGDVVVDGGVVAEVTPGGMGSSAVDPGTEVIDLDGATVLPGLWDSHVHSVQWALARRRIDLSAAGSAREAAEVARQAALARPGEIVQGYGFRDALWPDVPEAGLLPADATVVMVSNDLHTAWLSRGALALTGYGDHPTGVLREHECFDVLTRLPSASADDVDAWVAEAMRAAAARGVTGILDFELADNVTDWRRRVRAGEVAVRVRCSVPRIRLEEAIAAGWHTGSVVPDAGGLLEIGPVKIFTDGSLNTRTAYCADPYPGTDGCGLLETPPDELASVMRRAASNGLHPAVHAIGDLANAVVLDAFEALGGPGRIEHAQLVRSADIGRFARPGLIAGVQPAHCPDDRDVADVLWQGRTGRAYPYRSLLEAGAVLEFGSDAPVAPLDPWDGIASAVARSDDGRPAWHPEQALSVTDALAASSRGRRDIRAGSAADLVIVAGDPARLAPSDLRDIPVLGTLLGGAWTHRDEAL